MTNSVPKDKVTEAEVQDYVSDHYEEIRYKLPYSVMYHDWWSKQMLSFLTRKGRILDNGCGIGNMIEMLSSEDVVGLDISEKMLIKAKTRGKKVLRGDSMHLPFANCSFDIVLGRSLLHHLPDPAQGVDEMHRVLKRGGELLIVDTNQSVLNTLPRKIISRGKHFSDDHKNFDVAELTRILESKFQIDNVYHFGYIAYPLIGFPDLVPVFKFVPFKTLIAGQLIKLDVLMSKIPVVNKQSWGIMIKASKKPV